MNKILTFATSLSLTSIGLYAQRGIEYNNFESISKLEKAQDLNLSANQVKRLKEINKSLSSKYSEIGQNSSLSGYEKGIKKRELALKQKEEISRILNEDQEEKWNKTYDKNFTVCMKNQIEKRLDMDKQNNIKKKVLNKNNYLNKENLNYKKKL